MIRMKTNIDSAVWTHLESVVSKLPQEIRDKPIRIAVTRAARRVAQKQSDAVRAMQFNELDNRQQLRPRLWEIIGFRVKSYGKHLYTIAGASRGYRAGYHAHLVDGGHKIVKRGTGTLFESGKKKRTRKSAIKRTGMGQVIATVKARPFIKPAAQEVYGSFGDELISSVEKFVRNWEKRTARAQRRAARG